MSVQALSDPSIFSVGNDITSTLVDTVNHSQLRSSPFEYIYMENVFAPAMYREMLENLPDTRHFHLLKKSGRLRLYLYPEGLGALPAGQREIWTKTARALLSSALQDAFRRKFQTVLENRFGKSIDRLSFYPVPILVRDLPGYHIGVHSDVPDKAITVQFYMPRDASQVHLGTTFHEAKTGPGHDKTTSMKFLPSSGYAFPVNLTASWHSVKATTEADGPRNSMMLTYYVQETPKAWLKMRRQRLGNFLGHPSAH